MSRFYPIFSIICLNFGVVTAQYIENFDAFCAGSSYENGNFIGTHTTWYYSNAKGGQSISESLGTAICMNKAEDASVFSDSITGGCSKISFYYKQEYTTNCNAQVFINDILLTQLITKNEQDIPKYFEIDELQICNKFVMKIKQSESTSGHLTIDSIAWKPFNCKEIPVKLLHTIYKDNSIILSFSKNLDKTRIGEDSFKTTFQIQKYFFIDARSICIIPIVDTCGSGQLKIKNIFDTDALQMADTLLSIEIPKTPGYGDIVINELMIDPAPPIGLPDSEYIELYNTSNCDIDITAWNLCVGTTCISLPGLKMNANTYLVLSKDTLPGASELFCTINFPALANTGNSITLLDTSRTVIAYIKYSNQWYNNALKEDGGWSLEKIDYANFQEDENNWAASINIAGGTPGHQNSVSTLNPDISAPIILYSYATTSKTVFLQFNENTIINETISCTPYIGIDSIRKVSGTTTNFLLHLSTPLSKDTIYTINIQNISDISNNFAECNITIAMEQAAETGDLLINEILFNPYPESYDFVEIYNNSEKAINMDKIYIANCTIGTEDFINYSLISEQPQLLFPGMYLVIAKNTGNIKETYNTDETAIYINCTHMPAYSDEDGCAMILNSEQLVIDKIEYSQEMHHALLSDSEGVSLERISMSTESLRRDNWHSASDLSGFATPGYNNSQSNKNKNDNNGLSLQKNTFTPNNDGIDDVLIIHYNSDYGGYTMNAYIYNGSGIKIKTLYKNLLLGTSASLIWDGTNDDMDIIPNGIYIIVCNLFHENGHIFKVKFACAKGM